MVVGYALGNKQEDEKNESEILVLGEDKPDVITYSKSTRINLYGYSEKKYSSLSIPYTTIKKAKTSRKLGIREAVYEVFHRPDKSPLLRSMLDLWGFDTYDFYLYTICELGFLEGLIPVIDFGFITPDEMTRLSEVSAIIKNPLFSEYDVLMDQDGIRSLTRSYDIHEKCLTWALKLGHPTSTGFFVTDKMDMSKVTEYATVIAEAINKYGHVHEVVLMTQSRSSEIAYKPVSTKFSIKLYEKVRALIPDSVPVLVSDPSIEVTEAMLSNGERDLGSFSDQFLNSESGQIYWEALHELIGKRGLSLQQRFPLRQSFIKEQQYSKKLGQVFDAYKYKIKKELLEKQKEMKS